MPIIEIGAPKPGMSGQGWVDPMAELRDVEAQERDNALFGAAVKVVGAAWKGKKQFDDREKASAVKAAQVGLNESLARVKKGADLGAEREFIEGDSWAPEGFKANHPQLFQQVKDSALASLDPSEVSYEQQVAFNRDTLRQKKQLAAYSEHMESLGPLSLEELQAATEDYIEGQNGRMSEQDLERLSLKAEGAPGLIVMHNEFIQKRRDNQAKLDSFAFSVNGLVQETLDSWANGTAVLGKLSLKEFVSNHSETLSFGTKGTELHDKQLALANTHLTNLYKTLKAQSRTELDDIQKNEFVREYTNISSLMRNLTASSSPANVEKALNAVKGAFEGSYWNPPPGEGGMRAVNENLRMTRAGQIEFAEAVAKSKIDYWKQASTKHKVNAIATGRIMVQLPPNVTEAILDGDVEGAWDELVDWIGNQTFDTEEGTFGGQALIDDNTLDVKALFGQVLIAADALAGNVSAAQNTATIESLKNDGHSMGARAEEAIKYPNEEQIVSAISESFGQAFSESPPHPSVQQYPTEPLANLQVQLGAAGPVTNAMLNNIPLATHRNSIRTDHADSLKMSIRENLAKRLASGEIGMGGWKPETFFRQVRDEYNSFLSGIGVGASELIKEGDVEAGLRLYRETNLNNFNARVGVNSVPNYMRALGATLPSDEGQLVRDFLDPDFEKGMSRLKIGEKNELIAGALSATRSGQILRNIQHVLSDPEMSSRFTNEGREELVKWEFDLLEHQRGLTALLLDPSKAYTDPLNDLNQAFLRAKGITTEVTEGQMGVIHEAVQGKGETKPEETAMGFVQWVTRFAGSEGTTVQVPVTDEDGETVGVEERRIPTEAFFNQAVDEQVKSILPAIRSGTGSRALGAINRFFDEQASTRDGIWAAAADRHARTGSTELPQRKVDLPLSETEAIEMKTMFDMGRRILDIIGAKTERGEELSDTDKMARSRAQVMVANIAGQNVYRAEDTNLMARTLTEEVDKVITGILTSGYNLDRPFEFEVAVGLPFYPLGIRPDATFEGKLDEMGVSSANESGKEQDEAKRHSTLALQAVQSIAYMFYGDTDDWPDGLGPSRQLEISSMVVAELKHAADGVLSFKQVNERIIKKVIAEVAGIPTPSNSELEAMTVEEVWERGETIPEMVGEMVGERILGATVGHMGHGKFTPRRHYNSRYPFFGDSPTISVVVDYFNEEVIVGPDGKPERHIFPVGSYTDPETGDSIPFDFYQLYEASEVKAGVDLPFTGFSMNPSLVYGRGPIGPREGPPIEAEVSPDTPREGPPIEGAEADKSRQLQSQSFSESFGPSTSKLSSGLAPLRKLLSDTSGDVFIEDPAHRSALRDILLNNAFSPAAARAFDPMMKPGSWLDKVWDTGFSISPWEAGWIDAEWSPGAFIYRTTKYEAEKRVYERRTVGQLILGGGHEPIKEAFTRDYLLGFDNFYTGLSDHSKPHMKPVWNRLQHEQELARQWASMQQRVPFVGVHAGTAQPGATAAGIAGGAKAGSAVGRPVVGGFLGGTAGFISGEMLPLATASEAHAQFDPDSITPEEVRMAVIWVANYGGWEDRRAKDPVFMEATKGDVAAMEKSYKVVSEFLNLSIKRSTPFYIEGDR